MRSILLLHFPSGWYLENFLPIKGRLSRFKSRINPSRASILFEWIELPLPIISPGSLIELKSPAIHTQPSSFCWATNWSQSYRSILSANKLGAQIFTIQHLILSAPQKPLITTAPTISHVLTTLNVSAFQRQWIPPDMPFEFFFVQSKFPNPQISLQVSILKFSSFISWTQQKSNLFFLIKEWISFLFAILPTPPCLSPSSAHCCWLLAVPFLIILCQLRIKKTNNLWFRKVYKMNNEKFS